MNDVQERHHAWNILVQSCNMEEYDRLCQVIDKMEKSITTDGINNEYGLVDVYESYMSVPTYKTIRDLIHNPEETIVVDIGCGDGIQQILFKDCYKYIGLDYKNPDKIVDNAEFIKGDITETLPKLEFEPYKNVYGISVLCAMCFGNVEKIMKEKFRKCVII